MPLDPSNGTLKKYADDLFERSMAELKEAVENIRREQDILAARDAEAAARVLQTVQNADLATQRKFELVQQQLDELNMLKTDLAIQNAQVISLRREMQIIQNAADLAISKSEMATDRRIEGLNAFRQQLTDQAGTFMPREVSDVAFSEIRHQIQVLTARVDLAAGRSIGSNATIGLVVAAITIISTIVLLANGKFG